MSITPAALRKLRKQLPRGYQQEVANAMGNKYHRSMIGYVANGQRSNDEIVAALIRYAKQHAQAQARLAKAIKTI